MNFDGAINVNDLLEFLLVYDSLPLSLKRNSSQLDLRP